VETADVGREYPPEAYAPNGTLWWRLTIRPGSATARFGDEQKIAAWLAFNREVGQTFTMRQLRAGIGEDQLPNDAEHLNRRLRALRLGDGWQIPSQRDDGSLAVDEYRVRAIGWHPGTGSSRPASNMPSDKVRRKVFERDRWTCAVCGVASKEAYDDIPDKTARMTLGHRIPGKRLEKTATVDELQTECSRCNEAVRDEVFDPVTLPEILPTVRGLPRNEKRLLLDWLRAGRRPIGKLERVYADARRLSEVEVRQLVSALGEMTTQQIDVAEPIVDIVVEAALLFEEPPESPPGQ